MDSISGASNIHIGGAVPYKTADIRKESGESRARRAIKSFPRRYWFPVKRKPVTIAEIADGVSSGAAAHMSRGKSSGAN